MKQKKVLRGTDSMVMEDHKGGIMNSSAAVIDSLLHHNWNWSSRAAAFLLIMWKSSPLPQF